MAGCSNPQCFDRGYPSDWQTVKEYTAKEYDYPGAQGDIFAPGLFVALCIAIILGAGAIHWLAQWFRRRW
jgi:hypothetical protein